MRDQIPLPYLSGANSGYAWLIDRVADSASWIYAARLFKEHGRWVVGELRILPAPATDDLLEQLFDADAAPKTALDGGITARLLRRLALPNKVARASSELSRRALNLELAARTGTLMGSRIGGPLVSTKPRVPTTTLKRLAKSLSAIEQSAVVAETYTKALADGCRNPNEIVFRHLGLHSKAAARDAIHKARVRGFLTATKGHGHQGGELTTKATDLLKQIAVRKTLHRRARAE